MIKFHRPVFDEGIEVDAVLELDASLEDMYVRQNYANYVEGEEKPSKKSRKKAEEPINAHVEGE